MENLIKYAPDPLIPEILKKIGPKEFERLCLINEEFYNKLKRHMGMRCNLQKLPPLPFPRELYLFKQMFNDDDLSMYGTSHIKKVLKLVHGDKRIRTLERLENKSAHTRREYLKRILKQGKVASSYLKDSTDIPKYTLNIWISKETFESLYEKVLQFSQMENLEEAIVSLINEIIDNDDFLVNWGIFSLLLNDPEKYLVEEFGHSKDIEEFIKYTIYTLRSNLLSNRIVSKKEAGIMTKTLPKGELFYRGYRTYRGMADNTKNYAWFAFDVVSTMSYLVPPKKEDNKQYLAKTTTFTNLYDYCSAVGGSAVFQVQRDLQVLDFGDVNTLRYIKSQLNNKDVIEAFESGWRLSEKSAEKPAEKEKFKRYSVDVLDGIVAKWLCENGYDGYIANNVPGLHDEIMICNISNNMKYIGDYDPRIYMNFHMCEEPYSLVDSYIIYW
ncbi:MAG TPA: hypothetical protein PKD85_03815 [Saprospiraceae bacterium]|nr:hypothetical protein [Saprospiraceae bacterium]